MRYEIKGGAFPVGTAGGCRRQKRQAVPAGHGAVLTPKLPQCRTARRLRYQWRNGRRPIDLKAIFPLQPLPQRPFQKQIPALPKTCFKIHRISFSQLF